MYANSGLAAGSTLAQDVLQWRRATRALAGSPHTWTVGTDAKILAAIVSINPDPQAGSTWDVYDFQDITPDPEGFTVQVVRRAAASGGDQVTINYNTTRYGANASAFVIALLAP